VLADERQPFGHKRETVPRAISPSAAKNRLLEAIPHPIRERLLAHGEHISLDFADMLLELDQPIRHVFFPTGGLISLIMPVDSGATLEVGRIGDEGMLGLPLMLGVKVAQLRALVQGPGAAWRIGAAPFCRELERSLALRQILHRYLHLTVWHLRQTAVCAHFHLVNARLARWLLMTGDQVHSDEFYITQEFISSMLGVRRSGVNRAASSLQERKLIRYTRGRLSILDRPALEAAACGCYAEGKAVYAGFLG